MTRIQFYAFEVRRVAWQLGFRSPALVQIARNRLGLNDKAHEIAKVEAEKERIKKEKEKARKEKEKAKKNKS